MTSIPKVFINREVIEVSKLGLGFLAQEDDSADVSDISGISLLRKALASGINFFDTGEDYQNGLSESIVGEAFLGQRSSVRLSTKFSPVNSAPTRIRESLHRSLKRLKTDYIDLYQAQWPNPSVQVEDIALTLKQLLREGKCLAVGLSNLELGDLTRYVEVLGSSIATVQIELGPHNILHLGDYLDYCSTNGITLIAYGAIDRNLSSIRRMQNPAISGLMRKHNLTPSQLIIAWGMSKRNLILLTRTSSFTHLQENINACSVELEEFELELIEKALNKEIVKVKPSCIKVVHQDADHTHPIYTTLEQALDNPLGVIPSPTDLAVSISKTGKLLRPIELAHDKVDGKYLLKHGRVRFWAWVIAFGDTPIDATIVE